MGIISNPFFSIKGQQERLANVGNTLAAAVGLKKGGVKSNTGNKTIDTALSAAASHPFTTAAVAAAVVNPVGAAAAAKKVGQVAASEFSKLSLGSKAAVVVAAPVVASALVSSPKLRAAALDTPSSLANFGSNVGGLVEDPSLSNAAKIVKENPVISSVAAAAGLVAVGAAGRSVASIAATMANTSAMRENTAATASAPASVLTPNTSPLNPSSVAGGSSALVAPVADSSVKSPILPASKSLKRGSRRRKKATDRPQNISQRVNIVNIDDRDKIERYINSRSKRSSHGYA